MNSSRPATIAALTEYLKGRRFNPLTYSLLKDDNESYVLLEERGRWSVYYSERGHRVREKLFSSQADACEELLQRLENDPTTK